MSWLIILTFILTPTYAVKLNFFGLPGNMLMLWVILVWIIFFCYLIAKKQQLMFFTAVKNISLPVLILVGLFFLSGLVSLFYHGLDRQKLGEFIVLFLQPISVFFIAKFIFDQNPKSKDCLLLTAYYLLSLSGLLAILQYFTLIGLPPEFWGNTTEPRRAIGFFIHPNFYALWSAPLLALLIPNIAQRVKNWKLPVPRSLSEGGEIVRQLADWKFFIAWILGATGLLLSLSRAGWLGLAAAILVYLVVAADKQIRKLASVMVVVIVIVIISIPNLRWRFVLPFYGEKSAVSRLSLWNTGIKAVKKSPVLGLGLTGFSNNWDRLNTDPNLDTHNYPHNIFLDLWVETGPLGLTSLIGLVGLIIYRGLRPFVIPEATSEARAVRNLDFRFRGNDTIKLSLALFIIALLVQGQIDNPYFKNDLAMVFWIILSLAI